MSRTATLPRSTDDRIQFVQIHPKTYQTGVVLYLFTGLFGGHRLYLHQQLRAALLCLGTVGTFALFIVWSAVFDFCLNDNGMIPGAFFALLGAATVAFYIVDGLFFFTQDIDEYNRRHSPLTEFDARVLEHIGELTRDEAAQVNVEFYEDISPA